MSARTSVSAYSVVVQLGREVPETITKTRRELLAWAASAVSGSAIDSKVRPQSVYLTIKQLADTPNRLRDFLKPPEGLPDDAVVVLDIADAPLDALNEHVLEALGQVASDFGSDSRRTLLFLLSELPNAPRFWDRLDGVAIAGSARLLVLDDSGALRSFGAGKKRRFDVLVDQYPAKRSQLTGTAREQFVAKIVPRLGHFKLSSKQGRPVCGRYFFDYSRGVAELKTLLMEWLEATFEKEEREAATLVLCGVRTDQLWTAVLAAAEATSLKTFDHAEEAQGLHSIGGPKILVFDVVSSGKTVERFRDKAIDPALQVADRAVAVLRAGNAALNAPHMRVEALVELPQDLTLKDDCPRCDDGVPWDDPFEPDPQLQIAADDMWWMLDQVEWGKERYGPEDQTRYDHVPHLDKVFDGWGEWIAYKYHRLLEATRRAEILVVVCPEEAAVLRLVEKLSARFDHHLVAVAIPREVIDAVVSDPGYAASQASTAREASANRARGNGWNRGSASENQNAWQRQLRHVSETQGTVLILDEFNASGATVGALSQLVRAFGADVAAYLPFLDWSARPSVEAPETTPLYGFAYPRPAA